MARATVEDCLEHVTDQFALVHLAADIANYIAVHQARGEQEQGYRLRAA